MLPHSLFKRWLYLSLASASLLFADDISKQASIQVINGVVLEESEYPAVFVITTDFGRFLASCTATAVSDSTVLTAAHCLRDDSATARSYFVDSGPAKGTKATKVLLHPKYPYDYDVALAIFPSNTFKEWIAITDKTPQVKDPFSIIGYGITKHNSGIADGKKRIGYNILADIGLTLNFYGKASSLAAPDGASASNAVGDSGGPLLINGLIAGVSSSVDTYLTDKGNVYCHYTNLHHTDNMSFLVDSEAKGAFIQGVHN